MSSSNARSQRESLHAIGNVFGCPICSRGRWPSSGAVNWGKGGTSRRRLCIDHLEELREACRIEYRQRTRARGRIGSS
jgi:hypothetical protein